MTTLRRLFPGTILFTLLVGIASMSDTQAIAEPAAPTPAPTIKHDRDPWIFRCVLDDNARIVVVSLGNRYWAAYDAGSCALVKFWHGDVELAGAVYDMRHGPQPKAKGKILLDRKAGISRPGSVVTGLSTNLGQDTTLQPPELSPEAIAEAFAFKYRGYAIRDGVATFHYQQGRTRVEETPTIRLGTDGTVTFIRAFRTSNVDDPTGETSPISVEIPTSEAVGHLQLAQGNVFQLVNREKKTSEMKTAPVQLPMQASSNADISFSGPQTIIVETLFKTTSTVNPSTRHVP